MLTCYAEPMNCCSSQAPDLQSLPCSVVFPENRTVKQNWHFWGLSLLLQWWLPQVLCSLQVAMPLNTHAVLTGLGILKPQTLLVCTQPGSILRATRYGAIVDRLMKTLNLPEQNFQEQKRMCLEKTTCKTTIPVAIKQIQARTTFTPLPIYSQ